MADRYIDCDEVAEYGGYFLRTSETLVGLSPLVDMQAVRAMIAEAMAAVERERGRSGSAHTDLRFDRMSTREAAAMARACMTEFGGYLVSLGKQAPVDRQMFFPKRRGYPLSQLKPADVLGVLEVALHGFAMPQAAAMPQREYWLGRMTQARDLLAQAVSSKGNARALSMRGASGLAEARRAFVDQYNVAKVLVRGLLKSLGRESELRMFFLDMQVHEGPRPGKEPQDEGGK